MNLHIQLPLVSATCVAKEQQEPTENVKTKQIKLFCVKIAIEQWSVKVCTTCNVRRKRQRWRRLPPINLHLFVWRLLWATANSWIQHGIQDCRPETSASGQRGSNSCKKWQRKQTASSLSWRRCNFLYPAMEANRVMWSLGKWD